MMVHTSNASTLETEAGRSLNLRLVWSTERVSGPPGPQREILFGKTKNQKGRKSKVSALSQILVKVCANTYTHMHMHMRAHEQRDRLPRVRS